MFRDGLMSTLVNTTEIDNNAFQLGSLFKW